MSRILSTGFPGINNPLTSEAPLSQSCRSQGKSNPSGIKRLSALLCLIAFASLLLAGCATPSEGEYESEILKGQEKAEEGSLLGAIVQEWRLFSIIFLLISIGLIALAYPISTALNMQDLRAWADVELGEAFTTVLIVVFIIGILIFAEFTTHVFLFESNEFGDVCTDKKEFCPALVADEYLSTYLKSSEGIYEDLQKNAVDAGKLAGLTVGAGAQHWMALFISFSWKPSGNEMITVNMITQELQLLLVLRDALLFQEFLINHVSLVLAPMCLMLGIIMRSFFVTRKLGGQLIAFGIGFILVFPATYAISMYTVKATIYGAEGSGGSPGGEFCTYSCMKRPPVAYDKSTGEGFSWSQALSVLPMLSGETEEEYDNRTDNFINGQICAMEEVATGMEDTDEDGWPDSIVYEMQEVCTPNPETEISNGTATIVSCGQYDEICPPMCRTLPYPNLDPSCASRMTEFMCRENVPEECFEIRYVNRNDPKLSGLQDYDFEGCPEECRPVIGMKKEGCQVGYGFLFTESMEEEPATVDTKMFLDGYLYGQHNPQTIHDMLELRCEEGVLKDALGVSLVLQMLYGTDNCEGYADYVYDHYNTSALLTKFAGFKDADIGKVIEWDMGCPNHCRWITRDGEEKGFGCSECNMTGNMDGTPQEIWEEAAAAAAVGDLDGQIAAAEKTCVMIIPDVVFTDPSTCAGCNYVLDRGFSSLPPVHLDCPRLCGMPQSIESKTDTDSLNSAVEGFAGPAEMKSISALIIPALILPLLNIAITFIFIRTLSPIIGGGIEIEGMMRFFR